MSYMLPKDEEIRKSAYVEFAEYLSRIHYKELVLYDLCKRQFFFVSDSYFVTKGYFEKYLGYPIETFRGVMLPEEAAVIRKANLLLHEMTRSMPKELVEKMVVSCCFNINFDGKIRSVSHSYYGLQYDSDGCQKYIVAMVSPTIREDGFSMFCSNKDENVSYRYDVNKEQWIREAVVTLSEKEKLMIHLSMKGYSVEKIALGMCKSVDAVRFYRKQLFAKLRVKNISAAIDKVQEYGLLK